MTKVELKALTKRHISAAEPALHALTATLPSGQMTALLGPSGGGKTTLLRIIAGLTRPDSGQVLFDGVDIGTLPPERRGAVMVFQNHMLFATMTLAQNVGFGLKMRGMRRADIRPLVAQMLERMQLGGLEKRLPSELSGGQSQRAALARALILEPKVLLLDEPLSSLDAHLRTEMRGLIKQVQRETGITTLVVTHDQAEAAALSDQIILLLSGTVAQTGPPEALFGRPATTEIARFFGGANFFSGHVAGGHFHCEAGLFALPDGAPAGPGVLTIRPEDIRLSATATPENINQRLACLTARDYLGTSTSASFALEGGLTLRASLPNAARHIELGAQMIIELPRAALWILPPG
ncbi:MAG: ABC transporter ATP-binding protein [Rhodobacteraceae bacterium]|nr:ABC transporter ATP-binding protein [Paracoccaceae bacterium]